MDINGLLLKYKYLTFDALYGIIHIRYSCTTKENKKIRKEFNEWDLKLKKHKENEPN